MCNFDYGDAGFCEPCDRHPDEQACIDSGFIEAVGTDECIKVCVNGDYGDGFLPQPEELPCSTSLDCRDGHGLGHWMCNYDYGENGFCEPCDRHFDEQACIASGFITAEGTNECMKVCVNGEYDDQSPPVDELPCSTSNDCRELGHWMCNFDYGDTGFCEPCQSICPSCKSHSEQFPGEQECINSGFITAAGTNECMKVCVNGDYSNPSPPQPEDELPCSMSIECRDGHQLGHWMCNYDYGESGFCEPCDIRPDAQACIDSNFITDVGTMECLNVCVDGMYIETYPEDITELPCLSSLDCRDGHGLENSMCNFDNFNNGFCESCDGQFDEQACYNSGFITEEGFFECVKVCVNGDIGEPSPPEPEDELPCSTSLDCRDGHGLGHWMCNYDYGESGFCEPCDIHPDTQACIDSGFIQAVGTDECLKVCVNGDYGEFPSPEPGVELPCRTSIDCRDGHNLGNWMCNYDNGIDGFCEPCDIHPDEQACIDSNFIMPPGTDECIKVCVNGKYDEDLPTQLPPNADQCYSSIDCRDYYQLGHWMCNFDRREEGYCEPCENLVDYDACVASNFVTENGTNECIKVCVNGNYDEETTTRPRSTTRPPTTTTPTTTSSGSSCAQFDFIHDFLAQAGAVQFESVFTNEQDSFSRKPGRETQGLKRRKNQFTQWIDNIFAKMSKHLEKRSFINCFEDQGKLFDGGLVISEDFNQCPLIEATSIDEYFNHVHSFIDWLYADCGNAGKKLTEKLHHRWDRINQIKSDVQAHIDSKTRDFHILDMTEYFLTYGIWDYEYAPDWTPEDFSNNVWFLENNPPNNGGATWTVSNQCFHDEAVVILEFDIPCGQMSDFQCYGLYPEDYLFFATTNDYGDLITPLNCFQCGCQEGSGPTQTIIDSYWNGGGPVFTTDDRKIHNEAFENYLKRPERRQNQ